MRRKTDSITTLRCIVALILLLFLWSQAAASPAESFTGRVVGVTDGDSLTIMHAGKGEKVRLEGIDCPEKKQPFGSRARQFTSDLAFEREVAVHVNGRDRYGRTLAHVLLPDGRNLNHELLKAGLAWWFRKYSKDSYLQELENEARLAMRGLWADPEPVAPWEWRKTRVSAIP